MRLILALIALAAMSAPAAAFDTARLVIEHDGEQREALIDYQPDARDAPVLIALHGGLAGPLTIRRKARVTLAREGWVVIWPSALGDWNDGRKNTKGEPYDSADDVGFLRKMIADLAERGLVDPDRVFFAGPSIGGIMALKLLCDAPDMVAGAAIAIASLPSGKTCAEGPPKPILFLHGTDDDLVPPGGGRIGGWSLLVRDRGWVRPVAETMTELAARNGCEGYAEIQLPDRVADDGSTVLRRDYQDCAAPLRHYIVEGGGHTWPGSTPSRLGSGIVGETNQDISATREIEDFFRALATRKDQPKG
ncbi:MAG: prolyl oligopeptidase family serine peptidase [Pseudomonadota bacterium]